MVVLDKIDAQILESLNNDGRMPFSTIAKQVGLTAAAVGQRVQKLIAEEVIEGFRVILNHEKLGVQIKAMLTLKLNFGKVKAFYNDLSSFPEIKSCYRVTGDDCLIMEVHLKDNTQLVQLLDRLSAYGSSKTNVIVDQLV